MIPSQKKNSKKPSLNPQETIKKPLNSQQTLKKPLINSQKTLNKSTKNPQEKQKVISFHKNIKINVDISMRIGGIHSLCQLFNTISFLNEIGKV
jgi:hypothetical protein